MNTFYKSLMALAVGSFVAVSAQAAVGYPANMSGQPYVGIKVGSFGVDDNDADDPTAYGVYGGYNFDPSFGVEVEYISSDDADITSTINNATVKGEFDMKTYGAYGTYRYQLPNSRVFAKGKVGIAKTDSDFMYNDGYKHTSDESGLTGGIGLGMHVSPNITVEGEYDRLSSDIDLISLGAHFKF